MSKYNEFEEAVLARLDSQEKQIAELKALLTPANEDPFKKEAIMDIADRFKRNTAALTRKARKVLGENNVIKIGNVNYIERRHINTLLAS